MFKNTTYIKLNKIVRFILGIMIAICFVADFCIAGNIEQEIETNLMMAVVKIVVFTVGMFVSLSLWCFFGGNNIKDKR